MSEKQTTEIDWDRSAVKEPVKTIVGPIGFCHLCLRVRFLSVVHWYDEMDNKHGICWSCKDDANVIE